VSNTPAIDGGETWAQLFVGTKSLLLDAYGMKMPANFSSTLMDNITQQGAPTKLISNRAQVEISKHFKEILCTLLLEHGKVKQTSSTRILLNAIIKTSRRWSMLFLIIRVPQPTAGYFAFSTYALCSTIVIQTTLGAPPYVLPQDGTTISVLYCGTLSTRLSTTRMRQPPCHLAVRNAEVIGLGK